MRKKILLAVMMVLPILAFSQIRSYRADTSFNPIIPVNKQSLLKNIDIVMDMRMASRHHFENGRDDDYSEFRMEALRLGIYGKIHPKVSINFRQRFNRTSDVQTLDKLSGSIEVAYLDINLSPKLNLQLGKMFAYFGGYEYEYNPIEVLEYNDIQGGLTNYVTGVGATYQVNQHHKFGMQVLNSRTQRFDDLYEGHVSEDIKEPEWPVAVVGMWRGSFFDGKLQTIYSYSYFKMVKNRGTNYITLGHKYENKNFKLMYDFSYSHEQIDTKGYVTNILGGDLIAENVTYINNWIRAEYKFTPKVTGLITLMSSSASAKNVTGPQSGYNHLVTNYGVVPTVYYRLFDDIDIRLYVAYIGKYYDFSGYAHRDLGITNYNTGEFRIGFIAPLLIL